MQLLNNGKRDIWIEFQPFQLELLDAEGIDEGKGLARPGGVVQLVQGKDCSLGHPRQKILQGNFRRLVKVEVHEQEADDQVRIVLDKRWNCLRCISSNNLDFFDVSQETV